MALGWRAWARLVAGDAAALCVAGVALGGIHLRFTWHAWHLEASTLVLRGRRGTYGTGLALVARLGVWWPVMPRHFAWQAWHLAASTFVSCGRRGTWRHLPWFCVAGVALMALGWLWWRAWAGLVAGDAAALCVAGVALGDIHLRFVWSTTIFHTQLCHTPSFIHSFVTNTHTHTHNFVARHLSQHFAWQAWQLVTSTLFAWQVWHLETSNGLPFAWQVHFETSTLVLRYNLCCSFLGKIDTHAYTHAYIHTYRQTDRQTARQTYIHTYRHTYTYHFVTHNCFTTSFVFPSFPVLGTTFGAHYWKKLTCGVIRSFNFLHHAKNNVLVLQQLLCWMSII